MAAPVKFTAKVASFIARRDLLTKDGRYLVALSGGADSVALLRVMKELGYTVEAAHCNFHLRGAESDRDESFCQDLCQEMDVALHIAHFDTLSYAGLHKVSVEMAARDLRYGYFRQLMRDLGLDGILVAHHRNDSVETLLLNLVRGTGIEGLKGIVPVSGEVLRPLLCVTRSEITEYLDTIGQSHITDSSNLVDDVQRNKIRLNILPLLEEINPSAVESMSTTAERVEGAIRLMSAAAREATGRVAATSDGALTISIPKLLEEASPEIILWELLKDKGFTPSQVEQVFANISAQTGREWSSPTHALVIDRGRIIVERTQDEEIREMVIPETGTYIYTGGRRFSLSTEAVDGDFRILKSDDGISVDAGKVEFPLTVRPARDGDSFVPFGMSGRKLLSDFMTDRKMTLFEKRRQTVLTDASGRIVWVVGLRTDDRFRITEDTESALIVKMTSC